MQLHRVLSLRKVLRLPRPNTRAEAKKKAAHLSRSQRGKGGRKSLGKAMQDEFEAYARTLVMEKSKSLEEG